MRNVYDVLRKAIQSDVESVLVEPCAERLQAVACIDIETKKPFSALRIREYLVDQVFSLCVRTGDWSIVPIRFRTQRIEMSRRFYRLHLALAPEWETEDALRLETLFIYAGEMAGEKTPVAARSVGSLLWCAYVIGVCLHDADVPSEIFGGTDLCARFANRNYAPYTGRFVKGEVELTPNAVPMLEDALDVMRSLETHTASLGIVPDVPILEAIASATPDGTSDIDSEIDGLLEAADEAFSDPGEAEPSCYREAAMA